MLRKRLGQNNQGQGQIKSRSRYQSIKAQETFRTTKCQYNQGQGKAMVRWDVGQGQAQDK